MLDAASVKSEKRNVSASARKRERSADVLENESAKEIVKETVTDPNPGRGRDHDIATVTEIGKGKEKEIGTRIEIETETVVATVSVIVAGAETAKSDDDAIDPEVIENEALPIQSRSNSRRKSTKGLSRKHLLTYCVRAIRVAKRSHRRWKLMKLLRHPLEGSSLHQLSNLSDESRSKPLTVKRCPNLRSPTRKIRQRK